MTSETQNKDNIINKNLQGESKDNKEERINDNKVDDEGKPIHNYPYEFYEDNKNKIELKKNDSQTRDENKSDKKEIQKEENPKIEIMKENLDKNIELESRQINKNEAAKKDIENKEINDDENKFNKENLVITEEKNIMKQKEIKKEAAKEINKEREKKIMIEPKKKVLKEVEKKNTKEKKKEIKEEKKVIKNDEKEKKPIKEREKKSIKEEKKFDQKEYIEKLRNSQKKDDNIRKIILKNMDKKELNVPTPPKEQYIPPKVKELKPKNEVNENKKISDKKPLNQFHKTKLTQQTENNYNLMMQQLKNKDYKTAEDRVIRNIFNSDNKILYRDNNKIDNKKRKELIENFLQRNQDEIKYRQNNEKSINDRLKIVDENSKKRIYFNNKEDEQEYFDEFYNKQIEYQNNCQINLDRLTQQLNEEKEKNYIPEPKNNTNLNYFKNKSIVELSKYKKDNKIKQENNKENEQEKNNNIQLRSKKPNKSKTPNTQNNSGKNSTKKLNESKNDNVSFKNKPKLTKKEIDELTNKLHYEGELLKVKKQAMISEEFANNPNYHNFSKEKLSRSSLIILIKKFIYEYSTSVKNNTYIDCVKNPKLNYEQYIDILKDLYYLEKDALPEDYLEDDTMYKELWDKLTKFSKGPENSLESNILLLYILELNGFFRNEKIIKELETEIHWIKLEDYEELIANAKYIEENWDDLKLKKIENIKKLKSLKKYNPIHNEEIFNNNVNSNTNLNSININDSNHYITIIKGNTNYELIHGYSTKKKNGENDSFSELLDAKNGATNYNSLTMSNNINKANKNRTTLQDGYNEILLKKKSDIEIIKEREEKKLKDICTFKPSITYMNKKIFKNNTKVDLPKYRLNKSVNLHNGKNRSNNQTKSPSNKNLYESNDTKTLKLRKNKSNLQKMFDFNPLKDDKSFNERVQILKNVKSNEINDDNYMIIPMRFNIDYPSKFEGIGITINRDSSLRQFAPNIIFYNIKVNDKIRTLKYIEGDDLKLNVINFVKKNQLPDEVVNIILKKIKEKELEEKMNN